MATSERQLTFNRRLQRELEKHQHRLEASSTVEGVVEDSTPSFMSLLLEESCEMVGLGGLLFCGTLISATPEWGSRFLLIVVFTISYALFMCSIGIDWSYVSSLPRLFFKGGRTNSTIVDRFDDAINERNQHWVATLVRISVAAFSLLCYVASIVGMYVLDGTMSALVYALTMTFALATVFYEAYYQKKNKEAFHLQEAINQHTMSHSIQMTPHSMRLYIKCILASCIAPDDDDIKEAAQRLKAMFDSFDDITERYLSLSKLNDIIAKEEVENLLAAAEEAIATQVHHAINTLVGGSEADFVEKGVPRATEHCSKINASLEKTLQSLVSCVNRDQGERKVLSEIESLTTAYRQFAERDFPTLKDCSPSDDSLAEASCDDNSPAQDSSDSSDECLAWKIP